MTKFYVYGHSNDELGVFYVGKGSGVRLYATGNRSSTWKSIAKKHGYSSIIIEECESEELAFEREMFWIAHYKSKGQCCANIANGGSGVNVDNRWWGDKISAALTGAKRPSGKDSASYKNAITKEELISMYVDKKMPTTEIASLTGVTHTTIWSRLKEFGIPVSEKGKKVVCTDDGIEHESISSAAEYYGVHRENIRKVLSGKYKTTGGKHFTTKGN